MIKSKVSNQEGGHEKATPGWISSWWEEKTHRGNRDKHAFAEESLFQLVFIRPR